MCEGKKNSNSNSNPQNSTVYCTCRMPRKEKHKTIIHFCEDCGVNSSCKAIAEKKRGWCHTFLIFKKGSTL